MATVKTRALNEMPFLRERYDDGWPVTIYLERSLQQRMTVAAQRKFDEGSYKYHGRRFVIVDPDDVKDRFRSRDPHPKTCPTKDMAHSEKPSTRRSADCQSDCQSAGGASSSSKSTSVSSDTSSFSVSPPTSSTSSSPGSRSSSSSSSSSRSTRSSTKRKSPPGYQSGSILNLLRSYALPLEDAEHIVDLLAASGVSTIAYMRVLSRMASTKDWLREERDNGELTEVQMRLLREIFERLATDPGRK
ncbi:hypothetical protein LXA43DRAFT_576135 [Ganoderma leucocontextum]|nr:hypothetical protein LXA43DRAFT_576135 [Ganoderma leucocontextum]